MKNITKNGFMNIQLFAEPNDATTSQNDTNANNDGNVMSLDYEQEYKKLQARLVEKDAEIERHKSAISKINSEIAGYKRKELERMPEDQKREKEQKDLQDRLAALENENKTMKLEKDLLSCGFTNEETEKLIKGNFAVKDIADIIQARTVEAVKSAKASFIKDTTTEQPLNNSSQSKCGFALYQEQRAKRQEVGEVKFN